MVFREGVREELFGPEAVEARSCCTPGKEPPTPGCGHPWSSGEWGGTSEAAAECVGRVQKMRSRERRMGWKPSPIWPCRPL